MVETTYLDGSVINYYYISVVEWDFSNCESCSSGLCTAWASEYELSDDSLSWNLPSNDSSTSNTSETSTSSTTDSGPSNGPNYNTTAATITSQVFTSVFVTITSASSPINNASLPILWKSINIMQLI